MGKIEVQITCILQVVIARVTFVLQVILAEEASMARISPSAKTGENFAVVNLGRWSELREFIYDAPDASMKLEGKVFLKEMLGLSCAEISFNNLPPKTAVPFYHKHRSNEEIYIVIQGVGEFQVDDCLFPLEEGAVVRVSPEGVRCLRNTSEAEDLCWIVVQSRAGSYVGHTVQDGEGLPDRVRWVGKRRL
jgi:mannose-6-phosphate isomerase-like protein (cupin superfamily)